MEQKWHAGGIKAKTKASYVVEHSFFCALAVLKCYFYTRTHTNHKQTQHKYG